MFRKEFSLLLVISALFSGQIMAEHKGHEFVYVKNADHQLRHEADSDELRSAAEESAEVARAPCWQKSRKPDTHSAG